MHFSMNTHISAIQCVSKIESAQQQSSLHKCKISELSLHTLLYLTLASLTGRLLENFLLVISFFGLLLFVGAIEHRSETKTYVLRETCIIFPHPYMPVSFKAPFCQVLKLLSLMTTKTIHMPHNLSFKVLLI